MKLCKNCKHAQPDRFIFWLFSDNRWKFAKCGRTEPVVEKVIDPVTGCEIIEEIEPASYCSVERKHYNHVDVCGPEGKYWEPR